METLRYPTPKALMEDACNAIREKDGTAEKIPHEDVPDRIRAIQSGPGVDLSQIATKAENVLETERYMGSDGKMRDGTMPEIADGTVTLDGNTPEHDIPEGHHTGGGKVKIVPDLNNVFTPTKERDEKTPEDGKVFTKIILEPIPDIYVDRTGADAYASEVLLGKKFIGAGGSVDEGEMPSYTDESNISLTGKGQHYTIKRGFHTQESIVRATYDQVVNPVAYVDNSTGTTATAADIRKGRTARSDGKPITGAMPNATMSVDIELDTENVGGFVQIVAKATSNAGYISNASQSAISTIPKYNGETSITPSAVDIPLNVIGKYMDKEIYVKSMPTFEIPDIITPGDNKIVYNTAGKCLTKDIVISPIDKTGLPIFAAKNVDCSNSKTDVFNISGIPSKMKTIYAVIVSRQNTDVYNSNTTFVQDLYWENSNYFSATYFKGGFVQSNTWLMDATGFRGLKEEDEVEFSRSGTTIQITCKSGWFHGMYRVLILGIQ